MANTKSLDPKKRKKAKRKQRGAIKAKLLVLPHKARKELAKFEGSVKKFLAERDAKLAAAAAAPAPEAAAAPAPHATAAPAPAETPQE